MSTDDLTANLDDHQLLLHLLEMFKAFDTRQQEFDSRLQQFDSRLQQFDSRLQQFDSRLQKFDSRLQQFDSRLQQFDGRLQDVSERLEGLETRVEERLFDTRPMWETVQNQIRELHIQITELREETQKGFRKLDSKWELLAREVRDLYADERELERRVGHIETKLS